jgi:hypothetical protein
VNADSLKRRAVMIATGAAACGLAAAAGWVATEPPVLSSSAGGATQWRPPTMPNASNADAVQASKMLASRSIWGAAAPPPGAPAGPTRPLTPPDWRILATVVAGKDRTALIRIGTEPAYELRIGDKLPGGAVVRDIGADRLIIELDGKRRALRLPPP